MSATRKYESILDAIGLYLEFKKSFDVLIDEIEGGFLIAFLAGDGQHVATLGEADVTALLAEAERYKCPAWKQTPGKHAPMRVILRHLGKHLDNRAATSIVVQERLDGFSVEFSGVNAKTEIGFVRLYETLDDATLMQVQV